MDFISYMVNGIVLVGVFYATKSLLGNEIQTLLTKDSTNGA